MKKIILGALLIATSNLLYPYENVKAEVIFNTEENKIIAIFVHTTNERKKMKCEKNLSGKGNIERIKKHYKNSKEKIIKFNMTCSV